MASLVRDHELSISECEILRHFAEVGYVPEEKNSKGEHAVVLIRRLLAKLLAAS